MGEELQRVTESLIAWLNVRADAKAHDEGEMCERCRRIGWRECRRLTMVRERDVYRQLAEARADYYRVVGRHLPTGFSEDGETDTWLLRG